MARKKIVPAEKAAKGMSIAEQSAQPVFANVIDSPPIDGFVPWVVVTVTDKGAIDDVNGIATPETSVLGTYPPPVDPESDYAIGILDSGASAHVMGNAAGYRAGLFYPNSENDLLTLNPVEISGVIGSVSALVSRPLGVYVDGLGALEPNGLLLDNSGMVGEWNVSIAVGDTPAPNAPDLPTAIGAPLSVYFTTVFYNDHEVNVVHDSCDYTSPDICFYEHNDPCIPHYSNIIPLDLRPLGGTRVEYATWLDDEDPFFGWCPLFPSTIVGNLAQSTFFVHSVDIYDGNKSAIDKDRFMLDTGAQVSVIGSRIASRLRLDPDYPDFTVEIVGVTGDSNDFPAFYIDSLEIPALGEWLIATNVPVVLLDIHSPEGGTVDGIIGMNLFTEFNLVLRGGGLFLQDDPTFEFEPIHRIIADIAPEGGDGIVDELDLEVFLQAWLSEGTMPPSPNWNRKADMAPISEPDDKVDFLDYSILADHWLETVTP